MFPRLLLISALLLLGACQSPRIERDFDTSRDFAAYRSWSWQEPALQYRPDDPRLRSDLTEQRIRSAIEQQLEQRGLRPAQPGNPSDLRVQAWLIVDQRQEQISTHWGGYWGGYWGGPAYSETRTVDYQVASARRQGSVLSLVLLDIDHFKRVNDNYGHAGGDTCLSGFADCMRQVFRRDSDVLLRLGGEEFGVLMPGTPMQEACILAERFRAALAAHGFELPGKSLQLTTSLGIGSFEPTGDKSAEAFFKRVDDALYRAKAEGRDRLALAEVRAEASRRAETRPAPSPHSDPAD